VVFAKQLREGIRRGVIRCTIRIWQHPRVKAGGRYKMEDGHVVVDSINEISVDDITDRLARESGSASVGDLLGIAKHGAGEHVYLIRFHYLPPGGWTRRNDW
jgi:hypothetical protein